MDRNRRARLLLVVGLALMSQWGCAQNHDPINVRTTGALADGKSEDTAAFQKAIDECAAAGGGEVVVPPGDYLIGSIELKSNTTLNLQSGANLLGSPDLDDYPIVQSRWEGVWVKAHRGLIYAKDANHIGIVGPGHIVGNPNLGGRVMPRRPVVIEPMGCHDVRLEGFSTQQRRMWTIHPIECENVVAKNLTIRSSTGNGDGIDVDSCRHVRIEDCDIDTGDDCIAIKSGRGLQAYQEALASEDVFISGCKLGDGLYACIGLGSETSGGIRHVRIEHCTFTHAKTFSIYIKSHIGRGSSIEDISANDLTVESATGGFLRVELLNSGHTDSDPVPGDEGVPLGKNFSFTNVKLVQCNALIKATSISPIKPLENLTVSNVTGQCEKGIVLANVIHANLSGIDVAIASGPKLTIWNTTGVGLDGAIVAKPTTAPIVGVGNAATSSMPSN
jgi:polygalacturonase